MKSKKKFTALEEAYRKTKTSELENIVEFILSESTSLSLLLENSDELAELSEKIATFEQIAESSKVITPNLSKFISENCRNIFESVKHPELLENSLNGLAVVSNILRTQNSSYEFQASTRAARCLTFESLDKLIVVCDEVKKLNEKQLNAFKEYAPEIKSVLTNSFIKEEALTNTNKNESILLEAANLDQLARTLDQLETVIDKQLGDKFKYTKQGFDKFHQDFENFAMDSKGGEEAQNNLVAQARLIVGMFNTLGRIWPNFTRVFRRQFDFLDKVAKKLALPNDNLVGISDQLKQIKSVEEQLRKGLQDQLSYKNNLVDTLKRKFPGLKYPKSLNPNVVIQDILNILSEPETANINEKQNLKEGLETLNKLMGSLVPQTSQTTTTVEKEKTSAQPQQNELKPAGEPEPAAKPESTNQTKNHEDVMQNSLRDPLTFIGLGIRSLKAGEERQRKIEALKKALETIPLEAKNLENLSNEIAKLYTKNFSDSLSKSGKSQTVSASPQTLPKT